LSVLLAAYDFEVGAYGFNDVPIISRLVVEIALGAVIYSFSILLFCGDRLKLIADSLKKKR